MSEALQRGCPACGAETGQPCIGKRGPRIAFHRERGRRVRVSRPSNWSKNRVEEFVQASAQEEVVRYLERVDHLRRYCGSPIEELLIAALYEASRIGGETDIVFMTDSKPAEEPYNYETAYIYQQAQVGPYRVDFLIHDASKPYQIAAPRWMIVECDGHDFHERTKEQARHDKKRDRFFQSKGYKVLRFTGSEIWANPEECADEVLSQLAVDDDWRNREK